MKNSAGIDCPAVARDAVDAGAVGPTRAARLATALRQVFGIPDYERYLAHMACAHPGEPPLSRRDFCADAIDRRFSRNGPRCC